MRYVRPGGTIAVWLYGYENNGFVRHAVEPLRRFTTKLPRSVLRAVAWPLAVGFHGVANGVYRPLENTRAGKALPLDEYMSSVADFSFRQNYGSSSTSSPLRPPRTSRARSSRLGSPSLGSRTCGIRIATATRGGEADALPVMERDLQLANPSP